jgi:hypothetical protein
MNDEVHRPVIKIEKVTRKFFQHRCGEYFNQIIFRQSCQLCQRGELPSSKDKYQDARVTREWWK